jgi:hypothetical protein
MYLRNENGVETSSTLSFRKESKEIENIKLRRALFSFALLPPRESISVKFLGSLATLRKSKFLRF